MTTSTIRERLLEVSAKFARIEFAVFTSFNFNADFFEQNVLPTLFGVDVREGSRKAREQTVHKRLADTRAAVFYDPSVAYTSTKAYRYAAHAVFLGGQRRFHPKCIFIAGTDAEGTLWLYVAVMSGNLGIAGWGRNCEGFFDTWVHARTEQPARATIDFFGYLDAMLDRRLTKDQTLANLIERLGALRGQRASNDPEGGAWSEKAATRLYFSPLHPSLWSFVEDAYGGKVEDVLAASPYWGEGTAIKARLAGARLQLVASLNAPAFKSTQLGADTLAQLGVDARHVLTWSNDQGRFFHIKLYRITIRGQVITGTGSCNFTSAGLQWGKPGSESGNVECMLFDRRDFLWPRTEKLRPVAIAAQTDNSDAPQAWPVYVHVQYDWERRRFSWDGEGRKGSDAIELQLPDGHGFFVLEKDRGSRCGELKSRVFTFRYRGEAYTGFVAELNLAHSDRRYGALLSPNQILESWRSGAPAEPPLPDDEDGGEAGTESGSDQGTQLPPEKASKPFDWFVFFRSLAQRRERIAKVEERRELLELLVTRTDSVAMMAAAILGEPMPAASQWIVVEACGRLLTQYREEPEVRAQLSSIDENRIRLRAAVQHSLGDIVARRRLSIDARHLLTWYEMQLRRL